MKLMLTTMLAALLASCAARPTGPSAEAQVACMPPAAMPGVPVEELYRRCREVVLREPGQPAGPVVDFSGWGR